jgi:hypothetical protein
LTGYGHLGAKLSSDELQALLASLSATAVVELSLRFRKTLSIPAESKRLSNVKTLSVELNEVQLVEPLLPRSFPR